MKNINKSVTILCMLISMIGVFTGCADVPEIKEDNGIQYAKGMAEQDIDNILSAEEEENILADTGEYHYQKSVGESGAQFHIDAIVKNVDVSKADVLIVDPYEDMFDKETVIRLLFHEDATVKDITEQADGEGQEIQEEQGTEKVVTVEMAATSRLCLESADGTVHFARSNDSSFNYMDDKLSGKYKGILSGEFREQNDYNVPGYTQDEAVGQVTALLKEVGMEGIRMVSCVSYHNQETGYYDMKFTPIINGLPIVFNDYEQNTDSVVDVMGNVQIGKEGISDLQASNCLWEVIKRKEAACISLDKAVKILEQYILEGDIICSDNITYTRCELAYLPTTEDWTTATLTPVWRFYVPMEEWDNINMDEVYSKNITMDICINAINGEIVYQR
ncbi:MAG: hypothetical protein HDR01_05030 [Lachnospiraceae bacterium]|nr:hypothetical protein [Lachnospiraceae bacterium]